MASNTIRRDLPIAGMDCADCAAKIERALRGVDGVRDAVVSLTAERATVDFNPASASVETLTHTIERLGYHVPGAAGRRAAIRPPEVITGLFVAAVALVVFAGLLAERLGIVEAAARLVPPPIALAAVLAGGFPIFRRVALALRARTVTPHALMTLGIAGALAIGEYGAAAVIVFFMRLADYLDAYTAGRARDAIRHLVGLQPLEARIERDGQERLIPAAQVRAGEVVLVKPGERIPVDGVIVSGRASVNQAPITGESVPVEREPGQPALAATVNLDGLLRVRAEHVGPDSTFGRIVRLVEEAEAHKSRAQRFADRVSAYYLPVVLAASAAAFVFGGSASAAVAVLVVSCSCGIALATPVAVVAAVGRAARRGILVKGGAALEALARADVLLLDKTGTLTFGRPEVAGVYPAGSRTAAEVLRAASRAERYSEHPLAAAIVAASRTADADDPSPTAEAVEMRPTTVDITPGRGVAVREGRRQVAVGSRSFIEGRGVPVPDDLQRQARDLEAGAQTIVFVEEDGALIGLVALADRPREGVGAALTALRHQGIGQIMMLTGDNEPAAAAVAQTLAVDYRAGLLPEDKIAVVRRLQDEGRVVAMVGDGINDAPALARADAGIAMDAATAAAIEAADVALMRDDWRLVPDAVRIGREAFAVIRQNLLGTVTYNIVGITLAAVGLLPPIFAAAAQVIPDLFILLNSARLLRKL